MSNKVIVKYNGGGWYSFSPNGHTDYNRNNEINVHGKQKCIKVLNDYNVVGFLGNKTRIN